LSVDSAETIFRSPKGGGGSGNLQVQPIGNIVSQRKPLLLITKLLVTGIIVELGADGGTDMDKRHRPRCLGLRQHTEIIHMGVTGKTARDHSWIRFQDLNEPVVILLLPHGDETTLPGGLIAKMWMEYIWEAFDKVNDRNAKAVVLYLAKYGDTERTLEQIAGDLHLEMSPAELQEKLYKLEKADIIAGGSSSSRYKGLGDKVFEIVFRKRFEEEIQKIDQKEVEIDIKKQLASLRGQVSL
jgi:hypothetical protein